MELLRDHIRFCCLSVDKSRDMAKNIFSSLTVIIWNRKMRDKRSKWYLKLKHILNWLQQFYFYGQRIIKPEIMIYFLIKWPNWSFSRSYCKNGHVTHHFEAYSIMITIMIFLFRKKHSKTNNSENTNFSNFFEMTS